MNGIPLQNLASQHAHVNGSTVHQAAVNGGNATSPQTPQPPSNKIGSLQRLADFIHARRYLPRFPWNGIKYWLKPFISLVVYGLTLYTAWSAPKQHSLLGRVSPTLGNWILSLLAKAGDIFFAFAIEDTFDDIAWRKLSHENRYRGLVPLDWFLGVISSTGIEGLARILWRGSTSRKWVARCLRSFRGTRAATRSSENANASWERRLRDWWKEGKLSRWAFARLLFILVIIPGPAIILMADVDQATVFFDVKSMNVSAGIATFDPAIANATRTVIAPLVSRYIQALLQDRSFSWPVDPIDPACTEDLNCESFLIAGPSLTVSPWPFGAVNESVELTGFRIHNAPFYQVDIWDASEDTLWLSQSRDCVVYGGLDAINEYSTLLCIREQATEGVLGAGWLSCQLGYSPTNGSCLFPGGRKDWGGFFRFYRRNATLTFSRSSFDILGVDDLSEPQAQNISSAALFEAIDAILYRPDRADDALKFYDMRSAEYLLTQTIGVQLWSSLYDNLAGLNIGREWLRNLITLPVYVFQPTYLQLAPHLQPLLADNGTQPNFNLPRENIVEGSYCIVDKRSIPGRGTVYAYTALAGLLLAFVIIAKMRARWWDDMGTSDFAALDYHLLTKVVDNGGHEVLLREKLLHTGKEYGTSAILDQVFDLRIGVR